MPIVPEREEVMDVDDDRETTVCGAEAIHAAHEEARAHLERFNPAVDQTPYMRRLEESPAGSAKQ